MARAKPYAVSNSLEPRRSSVFSPFHEHPPLLSAARGSVLDADDIPVAHTPAGGFTTMPAPILAGCTEPLTPHAPDLRGTWRADAVTIDGVTAPARHRLWRHVERIEQCGNRVVVTAGGVIHDMRADGTVEHGVDDVSAAGHMPIKVV